GPGGPAGCGVVFPLGGTSRARGLPAVAESQGVAQVGTDSRPGCRPGRRGPWNIASPPGAVPRPRTACQRRCTTAVAGLPGRNDSAQGAKAGDPDDHADA